jgi:peptide/nickel transport system permease protein
MNDLGRDSTRPTGPSVPGSQSPVRLRQRSPTGQALQRFRRNVPGMVGLILSLVILTLGFAAPLLARYDPLDIDMSRLLVPPGAEHLFGTDDLGRDVFARVLFGIRVSVFVGVVVAATTTVTGFVFGLLAGYYRRLDNPIMRVMDILMSFPMMLLALAIVAILGPQLVNILIALIIPSTPRAARLIRGVVLQLKESEFVIAARSVGLSDLRLLLRHLMPNCMPVVIVRQTAVVASAILMEAALTYLGVGLPAEVPTLGGIVSDGRTYLRSAPWLSMFPGLTISLLVLGVNLLGDGLRDILDPRMRQ